MRRKPARSSENVIRDSVACARSHRASERITPSRRRRSFCMAICGMLRSSAEQSSGYEAEVKKSASTQVATASTLPGSVAAAAVSTPTARSDSARSRLSASVMTCKNCSCRKRLNHSGLAALKRSSRERRSFAAAGIASKNAGAAESSALICVSSVDHRSDSSPPRRKRSVSVRISAEKLRWKRSRRCKCSTSGSSSDAIRNASRNGRHQGRR